MVFKVEVITLVPDLWPVLLGPAGGLIGRAFAARRVELSICDLRAFGRGVHRQVDDAPFGGGAGMVLGVEPLHKAIVAAKARTPGPVILLGPRGDRFAQPMAQSLASGPGMILICGRFEGVDERVRRYIDAEVSAGDFVLSAGDPAAWTLIDATTRLLDGVLGNAASLQEESFAQGLLEYPHYTRPASYDGADAPAVLRCGNHAEVARWRQSQARSITAAARPDLAAEPPSRSGVC